MEQGAERVKRLIAFKASLEKKVEELTAQLKESQTMLETVDSILLEKGFKRVEMPKEPPQAQALTREEASAEPEPGASLPPVPSEPESAIPLTTIEGETLASILVEGKLLRVVPAEGKSFNVNMPPFTQFLVERVLAKMQDRDNELARTGQLTQEEILSYSIARDGDVIREISIRNVDAERLRELKSSIRWTLEKMNEKMKTQA
jgi:hypothetical protein